MNSLRYEAISHVLLDIEGTTCPVSFVADTLFPYATHHLETYLQAHAEERVIQELLIELTNRWSKDPEPIAQRLWREAGLELTEGGGMKARDWQTMLPYLRWLMASDRKLTPLKDLQGRIWEEGYAKGDLQAPLFADVAPSLQGWAAQGLVLAVYSSGSVPAQQLLYGHSSAGDCRPLFSHWFDTRTGSKQEASSYSKICELMQTSPDSVLFISDANRELQAASGAGMRVIFSKRDGNPEQNCGSYPCLTSLDAIQINIL
jgi:enolase-phosphatase E1